MTGSVNWISTEWLRVFKHVWTWTPLVHVNELCVCLRPGVSPAVSCNLMCLAQACLTGICVNWTGSRACRSRRRKGKIKTPYCADHFENPEVRYLAIVRSPGLQIFPQAPAVSQRKQLYTADSSVLRLRLDCLAAIRTYNDIRCIVSPDASGF